jgi:hypothetical protein
MKYLASILIIGVILSFLFACSGCNTAYVEIGLHEESGTEALLGTTEQKLDIIEAGGTMKPIDFLAYKDEEGRLRNLTTARKLLDSALLKKDFEQVEKLQNVINKLKNAGNIIGNRPISAVNNKPVTEVTVINNSNKVIKMSQPITLTGIELGPGEQTPNTVSVYEELNKDS